MPKVIKIYGPPGTGKTTTLISILEGVLGSGLLPTQVAFITHTKAACEEVKDRVAEKLKLNKGDMKWFRTIHSLCCGMASIHYHDIWGKGEPGDFHRDTGYYIKGGFDVESLEDVTTEDEGYDIVIFAEQLSKATGKPLSDIIAMLPPSPKLVEPRDFLDTYRTWKDQHGKKDFTDMLIEYSEGDYPAGDVEIVIVDEAQDLSKLQWSIVEKFSANSKELYIAGDDDQSIYKFLGADEFGFLEYKSDEDRVLDFSYRCPKVIGAAATDIIHRIEHRKDKAITWQDKTGDLKRHMLDVMFLPWREWASGVNKQPNGESEEVMVLTRHRRQMYEVRKMLNKMKIPHTINGKSMATSHLGKMIRVYLELVKQTRAFRPAVVAKMLKAIGDSEQASKIQALGVDDRKRMITREDLVLTYTDDWPKLFSTRKWELGQIAALRQQINEFGLEIIGPQPLIDISTYHGAKGREADQVVLFTDCYQATWDEQQRDPDSETRLAYVGITRTRNTVIVIPPRTMMYLQALV